MVLILQSALAPHSVRILLGGRELAGAQVVRLMGKALEEQQVLLTDEPSLQLPESIAYAI